MKIFMLVQSPNIYGPLPKLTPVLINALQKLGCSVETSVWGIHHERENWIEKFVGRFQDILRARKEIKMRRFDVMIVQTSHNWATLTRDIPLVLATGNLCPRITLQMHGSQSNRMAAPGSLLFKAATKILLRWSDAVLVLSTEEQLQWRDFYPQGKFYVVDNPFLTLDEDASTAPEIPLDIPPEIPVLLFAGRLIVEKGAYDILDAMALILKQKECYLLIAGDGTEKTGLEKKICDLEIAQHVTLLGYVKGGQLQSIYQRANIFVLPSYFYEGFPTVVTEAMSFGLPIITTKIRGVADHLQENVNALFVPPRDPASLAAAILKLLDESDLQARMNIANREKVKQFEPAVVGKKYLNVLNAILDDRGHDE